MIVYDSFNEHVSHFFDFEISGPLYCSLIIMVIVAVLAIIIGCLARKADPLKPSKGLLMLGELFVDRLQNWVKDLMGEGWENFTGYFMALVPYLFLSFIWSITGLPSVVDCTYIPLSLAVVMFVLIHATAIRYQHWKYFKRYIDPVPVFLPVNLITMWTPIISTTLRMFGNALSGFIVLGVVQWALQSAMSSILAGYGGALVAPIPLAVLNLYFSLFSGYIQTLVFASLNAVWIAVERPETEVMSIEGQVTRPGTKNAI